MSYKVYMLDNSNYDDPSEEYTWGVYDTYEEALRVARYVVDLFLTEQYEPGMTAEELYRRFIMFEDTPIIIGDPSPKRFSGSEYARQRALEICAVAQAAGSSTGVVS